MSGFEIAGVVLGLFPIVCDAAKDLRGVAKDAQSWWQFQTSFDDFIARLYTERVYFDQAIVALLDPLQELSNQELEALRYNTNQSLWHDLRIQAMLTSRIDPSHLAWFMRQLKDIIDALKELRSMLPFERVRIPSTIGGKLLTEPHKAYQLDSTDLESTLFRLRISFSHKKDELLGTIKRRNEELRNYLSMSSQLHMSRSSLHTPTKDTSKMVRSLKKHQEQAESVFNGFKSQWICKCNLGSCHSCGISTEGSDMRLLLNGARNQHLKLEVITRIEMERLNELTSEPTTVPTQADLECLTQNSLRKRISNNMRKQGKSISKLVPSTLFSLSHPNNARVDNKYDKGFERAPEKLKKRQQQEDSKNISRSPKVQFNLLPEPVPTRTTPAAVDRMDQAISDMCLTIETPSQEPCLGFLELSDAKLFLHQDLRNHPEPLQMQSFEEFLSERHPRDFRLNMGLTVIMLILKLGPSWIPEQPLKSSIVILQAPGCPPQPFISHPSIHVALESTPTTEIEKEKGKTTFLALGIILLELLFRKSLEQQSFWATFTDNGKRHEFTDFAAASRWQKDAVYEYGEKVANAISKCVNYTVDNSVNLRSAEFLHEVWEKVLRPIEETLACSSGV
ncbi:hypothetical protein FCULG_00011709 [Fusarium culmorum]|uniref:Prion-inhibition and propagation HeLo domain-containing protein n=1 Tax=Fusarium culmorum TaxID=5516 RepID=A0A2T4GRU9_FUSCU|nr:hypothetical protein FCULG_00011709 [Fusarium culmorum]